MFRQVHLIEKTVAKTLSDQSDEFSYGVVSKIVSYKSVYIFTNKLCSVCLVFMYTHWFSGYFFQAAGERNYMGVNTMTACMTFNFYSLLISHTLSDASTLIIITCINFTSIIHTTVQFVIHQLVKLFTIS